MVGIYRRLYRRPLRRRRVGVALVEPVPALPPTGGGTVPEAPGPSVVDPQTGRALRLFVEIKARTPVTEGAPTPRPLLAAETSLRDPATWYGGMKAARLVSVSPITRELSGELRAVECRIVVADIDRLFRTYGTWGPLTGAYCAVYVVSDDVRYAAGVPYRLFAGIIQSHRAQPGFQYECVVQDVLSTRLARLDESPRIPPQRLTLADFPGMDAQLDGKAAQIVLGNASDEFDGFLPDRGPQGVIPPERLGVVNFAALWGGANIDADAYIWSQAALAAGGVWAVYYNPPGTPDVRIPVPLASYGVDVWTPGKPGWAMTGLATDYVDYAGRRYTPLFIRRDHPLAQPAREGKVLIAGNLYGVSDEGDGSGPYLDSAARLWQWVIVNQLFVPYTSGDYADVPLLDDTYAILDTDSVEAAHAAHLARVAGGYVVGLLLGTDGKQETLRHVLGELCDGADLEQGINRHGQAMLSVENPAAPAIAIFTDLHDIEDGQFETWVEAEEYYDRVEHEYGWRYVPPSAPTSAPAEGAPLPVSAIPKDQQDWTSGLVVVEHAGARAVHDGIPPRVKHVENRVVRSPVVAASLEQTWLARAVGPEPMFEGPLKFRLTTGWQGLGVTTGIPIDLGSVIAITHTEGYGQHGYITERGRVLKITVDPQRARVTLEGRLLTATSLAGVPPPGSGWGRVQAAAGTGTTSIALTFATPLTVGNGVIVGVVSNYFGAAGFAPGTCTDNHGHTYTKLLGQGDTVVGQVSLTLYYCPKTTATGPASVVTISPGVGAYTLLACAIEVGGVGAGLAVQASQQVFGHSAVPAVVAALVSSPPDIFAVALSGIAATQASFAVGTTDSLSGAWSQEGEALGAVTGEIDSRLLTDADTPGGSVATLWTGTASGWWVAGVAAFKAT